MKLKLTLLVMFTAIVSFACASYPRGASQEGIQLGTRNHPHAPITVQRTDSIFGGECVAKLIFDNDSGALTKVETEKPCVVKEERLLVNGREVIDLSGSIEFGGSCKRCYSNGQCIVDYSKNC
ncbi:hypothetical protein MELA_00569 [Candidatus Methylomirabilis lanthanidiphila]|uniref:Lipoprotein n=1 Tax=Candidatus Methylomirabilis lanthanidiphila TaxID=2211376 RepID=A0A564ZGA6_9BACT|nr:hypothetical protein MELA_00569 [Candidatus Methylomirabilis lanthanidiphila]